MDEHSQVCCVHDMDFRGLKFLSSGSQWFLMSGWYENRLIRNDITDMFNNKSGAYSDKPIVINHSRFQLIVLLVIVLVQPQHSRCVIFSYRLGRPVTG